MAQKVTDLQAKMIKAIATSELSPSNGQALNAADCETWTDMVVSTPQDKGVLTSLINAKLADRCGQGRDSVVALTEDGYAVYLELKSA